MRKPNDYLQLLLPVFNSRRTKEIFKINPTAIPQRTEPDKIKIFVFDYTINESKEYEFKDVAECFPFKTNDHFTWINVDGLRKAEVEEICAHYDVHLLLIEDILSIGQRPKMDEMDNILFCLLYMLYFNESTGAVEQEQISILLGKDFVISFQEDETRDVFNPLREKLRINGSRLRQSGADYLCYSLIDMIVDNYYTVLEKLGEKIELLEEEIIREGNPRSLARINALRKELIVLKRNTSPVRELVNGFMRSESDLLQEKTIKYFKDVYDHIVQAGDLVENYRDLMMSLQDLYLNKVNQKMNEVMKVMAIATCLLAPATVIGGIFGMNFDSIPYLHNQFGFYLAVGLMILIPAWMVWAFRKRGWF